ncbi:F-box domain-containing protein [Mycena chlorophos]|uniref:F-box domain-containing protein n=1 Tax=Mycena chlorophos TaxID=658473 RepID=A0A8H6S6K5_MYCCL|nr:F-box domain-containing protein [Mycena chlorophos]
MSSSRRRLSRRSSSFPPTSATLRKRLVALDQRRAFLYAEMADIRTQLAEVAQSRAELVAQLAQLTYPILTLPTELTSIIFEFYADMMNDAYSSFKGGPFVLGQVCRRWRDIALESSKLWRNVRVETGACEGKEQLLDLWFRRASKTLLRVQLSTEDPSLYALVAGHAEKFEAITCDLPPPNDCTLASIAGRVPNLRRLDLYLAEIHTPLTVFADAPALRELNVHFAPFGSLEQLVLPWTDLTSASFDKEVPNLLHIVSRMPNLETLKLPAAKYILPPKIIELPNLTTLHCSTRNSQLAGPFNLKFLSHLQCPAIEVLEVHFRSTKHVPALRNFIQSTPLNALRDVTLSQLSGYDVVQLLSAPAATAVERLVVYEMSDQSAFFYALAGVGSAEPGPPLLPALETLIVESPPLELTSSAILAMLDARCNDSALLNVNHNNTGSGPIKALTPDPDPEDECEVSEVAPNPSPVKHPRPALLREFELKPGLVLPYRDEVLPQAVFAHHVQSVIGPRGCRVDVLAPRLARIESDVGAGTQTEPTLYSLAEQDDGDLSY